MFETMEVEDLRTPVTPHTFQTESRSPSIVKLLTPALLETQICSFVPLEITCRSCQVSVKYPKLPTCPKNLY